MPDYLQLNNFCLMIFILLLIGLIVLNKIKFNIKLKLVKLKRDYVCNLMIKELIVFII